MMQAVLPICGLVDGVIERFSNETECCQREEGSQCSQEKSFNKCANISAQPWPVSIGTSAKGAVNYWNAAISEVQSRTLHAQ